MAAAPAADEVEVSLFGPGYGETVLVHVGAGDWLLIDSCRDTNREQPALVYLNSLGVEPATSIRSIVLTHWHDDHVRLAGAMVRQCPGAQVVLSLALQDEEFLTLARAYADGDPGESRLGSGLHELNEILSLRLPDPVTGRPNIEWAIANREIWSRAADATSPAVSVFTLSPSDASVSLAMQSISALLPTPGSRRVRAPARSPNHASVVL